MQPTLALYRRYRPETFAEVIGQDHVTGPLRQALANNRVNHAYLFSGPRGCGKTTSARILARRYRSTTFDEVIGQDHVARTLKKAIQSGRIAHAYLFCGTRGTGPDEKAPRAPGRAHLPLLPSGPGGVRRDTAARGVDRRA